MVSVTTERQTASASVGGVELRAETVIVQLDGQGRGVERINAFYRRAADALATPVLPRSLPLTLAPGRYVARYCCYAETAETQLTIRAVSLLCRRGRTVAEEEAIHHWTLPAGCCSPIHRGLPEKRNALFWQNR